VRRRANRVAAVENAEFPRRRRALTGADVSGSARPPPLRPPSKKQIRSACAACVSESVDNVSHSPPDVTRSRGAWTETRWAFVTTASRQPPPPVDGERGARSIPSGDQAISLGETSGLDDRRVIAMDVSRRASRRRSRSFLARVPRRKTSTSSSDASSSVSTVSSRRRTYPTEPLMSAGFYSRGRCGRVQDEVRTKLEFSCGTKLEFSSGTSDGRTTTHAERSWPTAMKFSFDQATAPPAYWLGTSLSARSRDDIARANNCLLELIFRMIISYWQSHISRNSRRFR
jgi:hypothetical protein